MINDDLDRQINEAILLLHEENCETLSPAYLQRSLMIDFEEGLVIFYELIKLGVVTSYHIDEDDEYRENLIGEVNTEKVKEFLVN
jgi:hypothetical protein